MELLPFLRTQARANRLANHRLHAAMTALSADEFEAKRTGFFPSLQATLQHILAVDAYYLAGLHGEADMASQWELVPKHPSLAELTTLQAAADERFIAHLESLKPEDLDDTIALDRGEGRVQRDRRGNVVAHLVNHQVHHRGQVHAMLSGTAVKPPQLDEFLMPSEAHLRTADLAALGWTEDRIFDGQHLPHA